MTDDFRQLLRGAADEAPEPVPDVISQGAARGRAIRRRRTTLVTGGAALLCATTVAATFALTQAGDSAGGKGEPAPAAPSTSLPVRVQDGELLVGCGGSEGWPVSVMGEGLPGVVTAAEMTETFEQILQDPRYAGEAELGLFPDGADAVEWRVLRSDDDTLTLGLGTWSDRGPGQDAMVLDLSREDQRWAPDGWGTCNLAPLLEPDLIWAHITGVPGVDRSTTEVPVRVSEGECTSARDPLPFLKEPVLVEEPDRVTVYWTSTPVTGGAFCPGNPFVDSTLTLEAPLGERGLYDGSVYPPSVVVPPS